MDDVKIRLEQELTSLVRRLRDIAPDEVADVPTGIGSIFEDADKVQIELDREMGLMTKSRLVERVNRIAAALRRLDDGVYGVCVHCGEPIKPARLRAIPDVETCLSCQEEIERFGRDAALA